MKKRVLGRANFLAARIQRKETNTTPTSLQLVGATLTTKQTNKEQLKKKVIITKQIKIRFIYWN